MGIQASIIILTYNNLDYTRMCLESIYEKTEASEFELIVVDNASTDNTPHFLQEYASERPNLKVIFNKVNQGFARGNNIGAAEATGDHLVFLNNDTVVTKGWLSDLLRHLQNMAVGMVGPVTNSSGNESQIQVDYQNLEGMDQFAANYTQAHQGEAFEIRMLPFQCVALRRPVFEEVGPLDESFGIGMFEDDDYALRLKERGYKILCTEDVFIHHWGSASFAKLDTEEYWETFRKNLRRFESKWEIKWMPHARRSEFIQEQLREMLDAISWLRDVMEERELAYQAQALTLKSIYESNGWAFLQMLLGIRRRIIPEGSRREQVFRPLLQAIRKRNINWVFDALQETKNILKTRQNDAQPIASKMPQPADWPISESISSRSSENFQLPERFPWPLVSVILPVHNHADMLEIAADSILFGTYHNLELIILDDGSTDEIEPVLERLSINPRVRIFQQPNQRLPRALTNAHQLAKGNFITWSSSDNLMGPKAIETMVRTLISSPEAVLVYADVALIDDKGNTLRDEKYRPQNQDPSHPEILRLYRDSRSLGFEADNYINACFLYRRAAAESLEGHFADDLRGLEDYDFWLRMQRCGSFRHVGNIEPLYYYRVHQRTMSHEILSQDRERSAHVKRVEKLIDYEAKRRSYSRQRWSLVLDEHLLPKFKRDLLALAAQLPVNMLSGNASWNPNEKYLRFVNSQAATSAPAYVRVLHNSWELVWRSSWNDNFRALEIWKGTEIHPLALKAREQRKDTRQFPWSGGRPVIGVHYDLATLPIDVDVLRSVVEGNPNVFFVFADVPGDGQATEIYEIAQRSENAVYLRSKPFGEAYQLYASFDAVWLPPVKQRIPQHIYRTLLAFSYEIARPFISPHGFNFIPAPYQYFYHSPDELLDFIKSFDRSIIDVDLLNEYLDSWKPANRLAALLHYANAVTQERAIPRPDFRMQSPPVIAPIPWVSSRMNNNGLEKCGLVVNTLDKGGLEEVVAHLALGLQACDLETFVICVNSGGTIGDSLKKQGIRIYEADESRSMIRRILQQEKPNILNSHWSDLISLELAREQGIPVVETIHSSYIWLDKDGWENEKQRSRYFAHAIATSQTTSRYYAKWNSTYSPDWITLVPSGINSRRLDIADRLTARSQLGLGEKDHLFLTVASYDGSKNQIGTIAAFERVAERYPQAHLLFVGNILNSNYYQKIVAYRDSVTMKERIELCEYRQDVGLLLSAADTFVLNSFSEGWSLAATEALLAGTPLIHSECGSAWELVGQSGERGIVVPNPACAPINLNREVISQMIDQKRQNNTESLIDAMSQMIENQAEWEARRPGIKDAAKKSFSVENMIQGYRNVFRSVLKS
jgi:GT2 family glycosyltransferase/glycosyltransferase involved in cell wall biosynthesis